MRGPIYAYLAESPLESTLQTFSARRAEA